MSRVLPNQDKKDSRYESSRRAEVLSFFKRHQGGKTKSILVVDDDVDFGTSVERYLKIAGFQVRGATTGREALESIRALRPDLIVLDWILGDTSGEDVIRALKADPATRAIPVIMISGILHSNEDARLARRLGAEFLLEKLELHKTATIDRIDDLLGMPRARRNGSVLIIEDDPDFQNFIQVTLSARNYEIRVSDNGRDGFHLAQSIRPDIILLDLGLPGLNGVEVYKLLQADDKTKSIPVLIMTAMEDATGALKSAIMALGVSDFIHKPFGENELFKRLAPLMSRKAASRDASGSEEPSRQIRGRIQVDVINRRTWSNAKLRRIRPQCFKLLCVLLRYPDGASKETLLNEGWLDTRDPNTLTKTIQRLREDLALDSESIVSTPAGYRLVG